MSGRLMRRELPAARAGSPASVDEQRKQNTAANAFYEWWVRRVKENEESRMTIPEAVRASMRKGFAERLAADLNARPPAQTLDELARADDSFWRTYLAQPRVANRLDGVTVSTPVGRPTPDVPIDTQRSYFDE